MKTRISQLVAALFFSVLVIGNVNATERDANASSHENIETALKFENWMMDETIWNTSTFHYTEATETNLELENWMTNDMVWDIQFESLPLENWMVNDHIWEVGNALVIETEQGLSIENWMMNENIWKI